MERTPVSSSSLVSVGYDPDTEILEIEFRNDRLYAYLNVPAFEYERLMTTDSKGKYFIANIKDAYPCERR